MSDLAGSFCCNAPVQQLKQNKAAAVVGSTRPKFRGLRNRRAATRLVMTKSLQTGQAILLTNDDGIESPLLLALAKEIRTYLAKERPGTALYVIAPSTNQSACGMKLTMRKAMRLERVRADHMFQLVNGSPADCALVGLELGTGLLARNGLSPVLVVSGINAGANLGSDTLFSGTFAGARQAGILGVPAIATSLVVNQPATPDETALAVDASLQVIDRALHLIDNKQEIAAGCWGRRSAANLEESPPRHTDVEKAFVVGDAVLNLNVPTSWRPGHFKMTSLGARFYYDVLGVSETDDDSVLEYTIGGFGHSKILPVVGTDVFEIEKNSATLTVLGTWPDDHPLALTESLLASVNSRNDLPDWLQLDDTSKALSSKEL